MRSRRKVSWRYWFALGTIGALLGFAPIGALTAEGPLAPPLGMTAPSQSATMPVFNLPGVDGTAVSSTDLQGKVVVVRFWATW